MARIFASLLLAAGCILAGGCGRQRMAELAERNHRLDQQVQKLSRDLRETEARLTAAHAESQASLRTERERWQQLQAESDRLNTELREAARQLGEVQTQRSLLNTQRIATQNELDGVTERLRQVEALRTADRTRMAELEAAIAGYREQVREYDEVLRSLQAVRAESAGEPSQQEVVGEMLTPTPTNPLSRRQFAHIVQGMTEKELLAYLGSPGRTEGTAPRYYIYSQPQTYAIERNEKDDWVKIQLDNGIATFCFFP